MRLNAKLLREWARLVEACLGHVMACEEQMSERTRSNGGAVKMGSDSLRARVGQAKGHLRSRVELINFAWPRDRVARAAILRFLL